MCHYIFLREAFKTELYQKWSRLPPFELGTFLKMSYPPSPKINLGFFEPGICWSRMTPWKFENEKYWPKINEWYQIEKYILISKIVINDSYIKTNLKHRKLNNSSKLRHWTVPRSERHDHSPLPIGSLRSCASHFTSSQPCQHLLWHPRTM